MFRSNLMLVSENVSNKQSLKSARLEHERNSNLEFKEIDNMLEKIKFNNKSKTREYKMQLEIQKMMC